MGGYSHDLLQFALPTLGATKQGKRDVSQLLLDEVVEKNFNPAVAASQWYIFLSLTPALGLPFPTHFGAISASFVIRLYFQRPKSFL